MTQPFTPAPPAPLPQLRQDVVLTLPRRERYRARVTRLTDDEIVLVLMLDAQDPLTPGELVPMTIEYPGPRGLVRLAGQGTIATKDLVRLRLDGDVDVVQRRDFVRVAVVRPLKLAREQDDGTLGPWVETLTANLSGNGLLAAGPDTLKIGDYVRFRVYPVEGEPPIEGAGRVARTTDRGQRGIAIEQLDREARRRLVRFIFECERIARQRTRDGEL
jgi:PilZ domain-containing protein